VHVEALGKLTGAGQTVFRKRGGESFVAFDVDETGRLAAPAAIDDGRTVRAARRIAEQGQRVDLSVFADPAVDL
jgi:hypothetical protein